MQKRQLAISCLLILAVGLLLLGSTTALFNDREENQHNTISVGTLDIKMLDESLNPLPQPLFGCSNWQPGDSQTKIIKIKNTGSLESTLAFAIELESEQIGAQGEKLGNVLWADILEDTDGDLTYETPRFNGCLSELDSALELGMLDPNGVRNLKLTITFDTSAGNGYQGLTNVYKIIALGSQA